MPAREKCCCRIPLRVIDGSQRIRLNVEQVRVIYADMPEYEGEYTVVPELYDAQVLPTRNKAMRDDVIVMAIPVTRTSNPYGGDTVVIG